MSDLDVAETLAVALLDYGMVEIDFRLTRAADDTEARIIEKGPWTPGTRSVNVEGDVLTMQVTDENSVEAACKRLLGEHSPVKDAAAKRAAAAKREAEIKGTVDALIANRP